MICEKIWLHTEGSSCEQNLVTAGGGNISARRDGKMLISPSGLSLGDVTPGQFVEIDVALG